MKSYFPALFVFVFSLVFTGCVKEPEDVFGQNSSERMDGYLQKTFQTLLNNKKSWMMRYYPSADLEFGGYTIFALFKSENEVTLTSDININKITSSYAVLAESGPLLTFNSYNKVLHQFSEPGKDNSGHIGADDTGMKGDFEFVILDVTDKKITLKGKRSKNIIVMEAIPDDKALDEIAGEYQNASKAFKMFNEFKVVTAKGEKKLTRGLFKYAWYATKVSTLQLADNANSERLSFRVIPGGLDFYKEYELEGVKFRQLSYAPPAADYPFGYYTNDSKTIKIVVVK